MNKISVNLFSLDLADITITRKHQALKAYVCDPVATVHFRKIKLFTGFIYIAEIKCHCQNRNALLYIIKVILIIA